MIYYSYYHCCYNITVMTTISTHIFCFNVMPNSRTTFACSGEKLNEIEFKKKHGLYFRVSK